MKYTSMLIILVLVLVVGIAVGIFAVKKFDASRIVDQETNTHITSTVKEILPISEYASLVFHYSDVIAHTDAHTLFGKEIPFTGKKVIYTIDGCVKLGFNGNEITISSSYNNIVIHMPKITILSHEIYPETFNLYDEKSGIFNKFSLKDANEIQMIHKAEREKKVYDDSGLFTQARESAEQQFRPLLENIPGIKNKYKIVFEWNYN